ncbi:GNAT family N-acetyltransferase [Flavihumibacter petaseus]|uniref:Putative acetyltransferase n=1 Tax=Flavihumibacter petaseus NBRC 106054 TaxID=1220578 RepID=A0A0E9N2F9_9BACT|nr:GNAT family N-acetyltransferase [Flavihumibacter petaseus]GAO43856.1 putative acetyltransferase [Flavihumibacter petaseus NBRC 106054]
MTEARYEDKALVAGILASAFDQNASVNYIVPQDHRRKDRLLQLMTYAFDVCFHYGKVLLSDDHMACALITFPEQRKFGWRTITQDWQLVSRCLGWSRLQRTLSREKAIKKKQEQLSGQFCYLWFIGVNPEQQGRGNGTALLKEVMKIAAEQDRILLLETSVEQNIPWYERAGLIAYDQLDLGYRLYFFQRLPETVQSCIGGTYCEKNSSSAMEKLSSLAAAARHSRRT